MKKISKILLTAIAVFATSTSLFANDNENKVMFGITAGGNLANEYGSDVSNNDPKFDFHGGIFVNFGISSNFSIEPGVLYSGKGVESSSNSSDKLNLSYLEIPVMAKYKLDNGLNFFAGPYLGILLAATTDPGSVDVKSAFETTDVGAQAGIGYQFQNGFGFSARYGMGFTNIEKSVGGVTPDVKNNVIGLSVSYMFKGK